MQPYHMYGAVGPCGRIVLEVGDWRRFEESRTGRLRPETEGSARSQSRGSPAAEDWDLHRGVGVAWGHSGYRIN
jgi:hypothetical protein